MTEENKKTEKQESKEDKKKAFFEKKMESGKIIRILSTDVPGEKQVFIGLTRIKGVSFAVANTVCHKLGILKTKKVQDLNEGEIKKITEFLQNPQMPAFLVNRKKDTETGDNLHLIGSDLSLQTEFDIKNMKKMRSYKGIRHMQGQPVRGQRTKSHFRENRTVGVKKGADKSKPAPKPAGK